MIAALTAIALTLFPAALQTANTNDAGSWDSKAAAAYLDQRAEWWMSWPQSARDHNTFCVSCHTALPYALGRPALRASQGEQTPSASEPKLLDNVTKRVRLWNQLEPFYGDGKRGAPKTAESRGTEAVLNALILANYDVHARKFSDDTRMAPDNMWALQLKTGEAKGAWTWLNFPQSTLGSGRLAVLGRDAGRYCRSERPGRLPLHSRGSEQPEAALRVLPTSRAGPILYQSRISSVALREGARNSEA